MKKVLFTIIAIVTLATSAMAQSSTYVNGYYRTNGSYVQGYYRTTANNTVYDNYSTKPNINPYTGSVGTRTYSGYSSPGYNYPSYSTSTYSGSGYTTPTYTTPTYTMPTYSMPRSSSYSYPTYTIRRTR